MIDVVKKSKDIGKLKTGDKVYFNGKEMIVDKQYLFQEHDKMNEWIIEVYNPENEKEYQIRYFDDQVDSSLEVYFLEEDFQYLRKDPKTIAW
ncbi:MAG: hypothetical protein IH845_02005 [Nanoarchaeota archaeon]|nr:hypothetical protein [Nanoarchaeota archaeon]